jgi:hypothetical protein
MPEDSSHTEKTQNVSLTIPLTIAIAIAAVMVITATVIFLHSAAYNTVKQIQIGTQVANSIKKSDIDTVSPIKASDIDQAYVTIKGQLNSLNDKADFGPTAVSDTSLGLVGN